MSHTKINGVSFLSLSSRFAVVFNHGQGVEYVEHLEVPALDAGDPVTKVRVLIHDDSYADQSYGHADVWDGHQWHTAVSISGHAFTLEHGLGYRLINKQSGDHSGQMSGIMRPEDHAALMADRAKLLELLTEVLG